MELGQVIVSIVLGMGAFAGIVRWGIASYMDQHKELEKMKERESQRVLNELNKSTKDLKFDITSMGKRISDFELNLQKLNIELGSFQRDFRCSVEEHRQIVEALRAQPKLFENFDLIEIKKDLYILKKRPIKAS